jgi:hypothetical protein
MANLAIVHGWFDDAGLGHPADDVCYQLARGLQVAVNQADNAERERVVGRELSILELKDASPAEIISKRRWAVRAAANHLAYALSRYEEFVPRHEWGGDVGFSEIDATLCLMSAYPEELTSPPVANGRRREVWHTVGHAVSPLIQDAVRTLAYKKTVSKIVNDSPTAAIGAAAIRWAYGLEKLEPESFASAMRRRDRRKR